MMKYFTREMWEGWQGDSRKQWVELHKKNLRNYRRQLKRLRPRLNQRTYDFFTRDSLHDGSLVSVNIVDEEAKVELTGRNSRHRPYPTTVTISVSTGTHLHTLSYSQVRRIEFEYPPEKDLSREPQEGFGWWGYDELTSRDKHFLGHDILFDSGAIISLEFKSVSVRRERLQQSD
jgi:hypothetical protein